MSTEKVVFLFPEYYALVGSRPELASPFALGQEVIVVLEGTAYPVVPEGTPSQPVTIPPTCTPAATDLPAEVILVTPTSVELSCGAGCACTPDSNAAFVQYHAMRRSILDTRIFSSRLSSSPITAAMKNSINCLRYEALI